MPSFILPEIKHSCVQILRNFSGLLVIAEILTNTRYLIFNIVPAAPNKMTNATFKVIIIKDSYHWLPRNLTSEILLTVIKLYLPKLAQILIFSSHLIY